MNRLEDERLRFYFEHEAQINEWAEIREDALIFSHEFYLAVRPPLDEALRQAGTGDVESFVGEERSGWPGIGLRRSDGWPTADGDPDVRLEWQRWHSLLTMAEGRWVGIRTNTEQYRHLIVERSPRGYEDDRGRWPAYKYLPPVDAKFWKGDGLERYRALLVSELIEAWRVLSPIVDEAVGYRSQD